MDTHYTSDQETFRSTLRRFLEDNGGTRFTRARWRETVPATTDIWQSMIGLGVTALLAPELAGGLAGSMADMGIVMEELGRVVHPGPYWASCVGATSAAVAFGQDGVLAALADGSKTATLALEEPGQRFTSWQKSRLHASEGKLNGTKVHVPDAIGADFLFVSTDDGVYLVATAATGLTITATECLDGSRRFAAIDFMNVAGTRLGSNALLAPVVDRMLVALCADGVGAAQRALELAVAYASERRQFDQHIGSFQAIQHLCADMLQQLELGRAGLHYALWALDAGDPREAHRAAVMCKAYTAEAFPQIGASAIQIFGGAGFTWEYDIQLFYKRLLSLQMTWGGAELWLEELATLVLDAEAPPIVCSFGL
jgi:alkylation response protein AidB-like acyl-CoA dehydrogenase